MTSQATVHFQFSGKSQAQSIQQLQALAASIAKPKWETNVGPEPHNGRRAPVCRLHVCCTAHIQHAQLYPFPQTVLSNTFYPF